MNELKGYIKYVSMYLENNEFQFEGAFFLWIIGILASSIVFLQELGCNKKKKTKGAAVVFVMEARKKGK